MPRTNDTQDGGHAYAEAPAPTAEQLFGVPDGAEELVPHIDRVDKHHREIANLALDTLSGELFDIEEIDGVKYRVSKGNEHFVDEVGIIDDAYRDKPQVLGFRLMQVYRRRDQQLKPILLVQNGNLAEPVINISPISRKVYVDEGIYEVEELPALRRFLGIVGSIKADSIERAEKDAEQREERSRTRRRRLISYVAGLAAAATLAAGIPSGVEWWQEREVAQQEAQAIEDAQDAEELAEREEGVRSFDEQFSIVDVYTVPAGEPGLAEASDQFVDLNVPDYEAEDISEDLAHDIDGPREVELDFNNESIQEVELEIRADDQFRVIHDGGGNYLYNFVFDAEEDLLIIEDNGRINSDAANASDAAADHIVIERVNGSN